MCGLPDIEVFGVTMLHTVPACHPFGYCLNINPNWAPLPDPTASFADQFDATELQSDAPYPYREAHCQTVHMDDTPNSDFTNCPTSHANGQQVSFVKCMAWQMGTDGINAGEWSTVDNSFVRVIDDAVKVWDSNAIYRNMCVA